MCDANHSQKTDGESWSTHTRHTKEYGIIYEHWSRDPWLQQLGVVFANKKKAISIFWGQKGGSETLPVFFRKDLRCMHASPNRQVLLTLWGGLEDDDVFFHKIFQCSKSTICFVGGGSPWNCCFFNVKSTPGSCFWWSPSSDPFRMGAAWIHADLGRLFAKLGPKGTKARRLWWVTVRWPSDFEMAKNCWSLGFLWRILGDPSFQTGVTCICGNDIIRLYDCHGHCGRVFVYMFF